MACAHAQPPPPEPAAPLLPLPRSSIAAILAHRGDLDLTDEQVRRLQERDDALDKAQADLRAAAAKQQQTPKRPGQGTSVDMPNPNAGHHRGQQRASTDAPPKSPSITQQMDDNDTRAYLDAEAAVLTEKQKDPAREIASKYREDLYDRQTQAQAQSDK